MGSMVPPGSGNVGQTYPKSPRSLRRTGVMHLPSSEPLSWLPTISHVLELKTRTKWVSMEAGHSQDSIGVFFFCGFVLFYFVGFNPWRIKTKLLIFLTVGIIYRETTINIYRSLWLKYRLVTFHITVQDYLGSCASLCDVLGVPMAVSYVKPFPETRKGLLVCVPWRMWPVL